MADISWIERAYTNFIYRDICHVFSGGLLICVFEYIFWGKIFLPEGFNLGTIGFLLFSFFIGLGIVPTNLFIIGIIANIVKPPFVENKNPNYLLLYQEIIEKYDIRVINELERINFLTLIGRTVGGSSLISGIFMAGNGLIQTILNNKSVTVEYSAISIFLLVFGIIMVRDYFDWNNDYNNYLNDFSEKIAKYKD